MGAGAGTRDVSAVVGDRAGFRFFVGASLAGIFVLAADFGSLVLVPGALRADVGFAVAGFFLVPAAGALRRAAGASAFLLFFAAVFLVS